MVNLEQVRTKPRPAANTSLPTSTARVGRGVLSGPGTVKQTILSNSCNYIGDSLFLKGACMVQLTKKHAGRAQCLMAMALSLAAQDSQEPKVTFGITVVIPSALQGRIYNIHHNTKRLPDFRKMKPVGTIYTTSLNIPPQDFRQGFPGVTKRIEWFAIDYSGRFWIDKEGEYSFCLISDDGSKLYIDGNLVIDNDGLHSPLEREGAVQLTRGVHEIRVSYFQGPRFHVALVLKMAPPGEKLRIFNTDEMKPPQSQ